MCALFGWLDYKGVVSDRLLKKLTQALANAAEERRNGCVWHCLCERR